MSSRASGIGRFCNVSRIFLPPAPMATAANARRYSATAADSARRTDARHPAVSGVDQRPRRRFRQYGDAHAAGEAAVSVESDSISPIMRALIRRRERPRPPACALRCSRAAGRGSFAPPRPDRPLRRGVVGAYQPELLFHQRRAGDTGRRRAVIQHRHIKLAIHHFSFNELPLFSCR